MNIILHRHTAGLFLEINGKETKPNYAQHITSRLIKLFSLPCHSLSLLVRKQKDTLKLIHLSLRTSNVIQKRIPF
jgi:hypothetical protein